MRAFSRLRRRGRHAGEGLVFDQDAADALAVLTLVQAGDTALALGLLDELLAARGAANVSRGLTTVCAGLLAMLEFHGGVRPASALGELGRGIAGAVCDVDAGHSSTL